MRKIGVDRLEVEVVRFHPQQRLAHPDQRGNAVRREVQPADQFLPARFGGLMQFEQRLRGRLPAVGFDGAFQPRRVRSEPRDKDADEVALAAFVEAPPAIQDIPGQCHAGSLAPA